MSDLTERLRDQYRCPTGKQCRMPECGCDHGVAKLCDEVERLEAELAVSKKHGVLDVMRERDEARTDFIRTQNELWRLEGLLRAWKTSEGNGWDGAANCPERRAVWAEAVRLAKEKPRRTI